MTPLTNHPRTIAVSLLAAVCLLAAAVPAAADLVTFDNEPLGTLYGSTAGDLPGDPMFNEDAAALTVGRFFLGGLPYFIDARIDPALPTFGTNQILNLGNVGVIADFSAPGNAAFEFYQTGGSVNIQVNGYGTVIEGPDFATMGIFTVAPGVTMSSTYTITGSGIVGTVSLMGPVQQVRIGGQELWIDDLRCDNRQIGPCPYALGFETLPLGATYGAPVGHMPGDWAFNELGVDVHVVEFETGGPVVFNRTDVVNGFSLLGPDQTLQVNNIGLLFDLTPLGVVTTEVAFEYIDLGGTENLAVNGSAVQIGDMPTFHGLNLGGATVSVLTIPIPGGVYGKVILTGDVQTLQVGGQEFFMDDLCIEARPLAPCDRVVDHQSRPVGEIWGASFGDTPGDLIFIENGIPVYIDSYLADNGGWIYNYCEITNPLLGFGIGHVMQISNVVNRYDIGSTGILASKVTFDYLDLGGKENLEVNNAPRYVGEMDMAPAVIAPGVTCSVTTVPVPGGVKGTVTLTGPVDKLTVGGQEFWIDTICVTDNAGFANWCNHLSDIESPALGSTWGGSVGSLPNDLMYVEDGMTARITEYTDPTGLVLFGDARVDNAFPPFGSGQILTLNNVNARYGLSVLGLTEKVRIEYFDGAGMENFQVNGAAWYHGEIDAAPAAIAPGVTCTVYENAGPGFDYGVIVLEGDVDNFFLGGQQFAIDNVCVRINGSSTDAAAVPAAVSLEPNFPNPFNPSTTLSFTLGVDGPVRLTVHDAAGRVVRTLVDEMRSAGPNRAVWDGRDESGALAAAGVYFVRVETRQGVDAQKIALIK